VAAFVAEAAALFGRIDTLVYAAGPAFPLQFAGRIAPSDWRRVVEADLGGCFNALHATLPYLREARGSFVAITAAGIERAIARDILSLAPKAAITALVRTIALEEGRAGVRANCVAPGYIAGGIGQEIMDKVGEEVAARLVAAVPLRRMGTPEEVADAVEYLSSARAAYITGTTLFVSGGMEL
jgi:NAD(P)-dependent dehydrogenase (short-subunit alcohol dehydrogenase family)